MKLSTGQIVRFVRNPPEHGMTGIWTYEYGLLLELHEQVRTAIVLDMFEEIVSVNSNWCSPASDAKDFIDDLAESALKNEVGSKRT